MTITTAYLEDLLCPTSPETMPSCYGVEGLDQAYLLACSEAVELGAEDPFLEGALFLADELANAGDPTLKNTINATINANK